MAGRVVYAAVVLVVLVGSGAWALRGGVDVAAKTTGDHSELIKTVPIERNPGKTKTALKLGGRDMPGIMRNDRVRVSAELLVTTDCTHSSSRCAGKPYEFNPVVDTFLVLAAGGAERVLAEDRRRCRQKPGQRQHHCQIAFVGVEAGEAANRLDCENVKCSLRVEVRGWSSSADGGERLIIGSNKPSGRIVQDKARLNVIRVRPAGKLPRPFKSNSVRNDFPPFPSKVIIYSQRLNALKQGEVIEATVNARASTEHLDYAALVGTQIVLTEGRSQRHGGQVVDRVASLDGEFTEQSGTNCTPKQSPCPIIRTGIVEMRQDARAEGERVPLYVNVIVRSMSKHADSEPGDLVKLKDKGGLKVRRFSEE